MASDFDRQFEETRARMAETRAHIDAAYRVELVDPLMRLGFIKLRLSRGEVHPDQREASAQDRPRFLIIPRDSLVQIVDRDDGAGSKITLGDPREPGAQRHIGSEFPACEVIQC